MMDKNQSENIVNLIRKETGCEKITVINTRNYPKDVPDFVMFFQKVSLQIIQCLRPNSAKVFMLFICKLKYSNHIGMNIETIAEEIKMSVPSVERAIAELKKLSIIISYKDKEGGDGRRNNYIMNPHTAWKGTMRTREKTIKDPHPQIKNQMNLFSMFTQDKPAVNG